MILNVEYRKKNDIAKNKKKNKHAENICSIKATTAVITRHQNQKKNI